MSNVNIPLFAKFKTFDKKWGFGSISNFRKFKVALNLIHVFFVQLCKKLCAKIVVTIPFLNELFVVAVFMVQKSYYSNDKTPLSFGLSASITH